MSLVVYAGSAQLATLPLLTGGAPVWVVWVTALCVNLRFVIFSAQWRPYFAGLPRSRRLALCYFAPDVNYVVFMRRFPSGRPEPEQVPYFAGGAASVWLAWQLPSVLGIVLADSVPIEWGLGFAGTLSLLALTGALLIDRGTWIAAVVAGCAAIAAYALPFKLNIVVAIVAAVAIGLLLDHVPSARTKDSA